jgi:hypothetical protein
MKKLNNKTLIIILVVLVSIFAVVRIFRAPAQQSNMPKELVTLDTAIITKLKLLPKGAGGDITFTRKEKQWTLSQHDKPFNMEPGTVKNLLGQLVKLVPQKMVTRKKEKWNDYQVGDSTTRVQVFANDDIVADIFIGRIGFNQNPAQMQQQQFGGGGGFGGAFTYVRLADDEAVYTVDGFLESSFNRSLDDFRDRTFIRLKKEDITKITFQYPDSAFVLDKNNSGWWIGSQQADSLKVNNYLNGLNFKNASSFADGFSTTAPATLNITIEKMGVTLAILQAWKREQDWALQSSLQPGVYFSSEGSALLQTLFERKENLLPAKK